VIRACPVCALVAQPTDRTCRACAVLLPAEDRALGTIPGAVPLLLALLVVTLAAMGLRRCEVEPLEDEHALPACVGRCS
jgi:hypothetical protein